MRLALLPLTVLLSASAHATDRPMAMPRDVTSHFSAAYQQCVTYGETRGTTAIPESECNARELRAQDAKLNSSYKVLTSRLSPPARRNDLRTDERNWIASRDRKCGALPDPDLKTECVIDETIKRAAVLGHYR